MAYTVLARRYRSRTFDDVVGQDAIAQTLKNAIATGRVAHGYLFCGTRGVGKTSMARILAKALNCLSASDATPEPCLECDSCLRIAAGDDVDCIEVDAASNTGVDNVRELRSNANIRPARSRFKIYIIDEVHMLSTAAFNALLKTLEEPPPHVKFILATTDPQKVPETVRSRVQRFDFRPIQTEQIQQHFAAILKDEGVSFQDSALRRIAKLATGSMRDGLSLLDQLLAVGKEIDDALLDAVLPGLATQQTSDLVDAIAAGDVKRTLELAEDAIAAGQPLELMVAGLIEHFRGLMVMAACGPETPLVDAAVDVREAMAKQVGQFDASACVYILTLLEELRRNVRYSGSGRALVDATLVRLADATKFADLERLLKSLDGDAGSSSSSGGGGSGGGGASPKKAPGASAEADVPQQPSPTSTRSTTAPPNAPRSPSSASPRSPSQPRDGGNLGAFGQHFGGSQSPAPPLDASPADDDDPPPGEPDFDVDAADPGGQGDDWSLDDPSPSAPPSSSASPSAGDGPASSNAFEQAKQDPAVRQAIELMKAEIVDFQPKRRGLPPAEHVQPEAEDDDDAEDANA